MHKKLKGDKTLWAKSVLGCLYMWNRVYRLSHPCISRGKNKVSTRFRQEKNHNLRSKIYYRKESRDIIFRWDIYCYLSKKLDLTLQNFDCVAQ